MFGSETETSLIPTTREFCLFDSFLGGRRGCNRVSALPGVGSASVPSHNFFLLLAQESFHFGVRFQMAYDLSDEFLFSTGYSYVTHESFPRIKTPCLRSRHITSGVLPLLYAMEELFLSLHFRGSLLEEPFSLCGLLS